MLNDFWNDISDPNESLKDQGAKPKLKTTYCDFEPFFQIPNMFKWGRLTHATLLTYHYI